MCSGLHSDPNKGFTDCPSLRCRLKKIGDHTLLGHGLTASDLRPKLRLLHFSITEGASSCLVRLSS